MSEGVGARFMGSAGAGGACGTMRGSSNTVRSKSVVHLPSNTHLSVSRACLSPMAMPQGGRAAIHSQSRQGAHIATR